MVPVETTIVQVLSLAVLGECIGDVDVPSISVVHWPAKKFRLAIVPNYRLSVMLSAEFKLVELKATFTYGLRSSSSSTRTM